MIGGGRLTQTADDDRLFDGTGVTAHTISEAQGNGTTLISGVEFYRLKATISDATHNANARGEGLPYPLKSFKRDFNKKDGEFEVRFDGTNKIKRFNWKTLVDDSSSIKFFGAPLSQPHTFDFVFKGPTEEATHYHRFIKFYDEYEGDVNACLALYNCYLSRRLAVMEGEMKKFTKKINEKKAGSRKIDPAIFHTDGVDKFLRKVDQTFKTGMGTIFTEWRVHTEPVVMSEELQELIDEAEKVFGDL